MSTKGLRIIIAGGRDFNDYGVLEKSVLKIITAKVNEMGQSQIPKDKITIISGTAKGADSLGENFAKKFGLKLECYPADWDLYKKRAGYIRNEQMAKEASKDPENYIPMLIAFWDNTSKGTGHMIDLARKHKCEVYIINY